MLTCGGNLFRDCLGVFTIYEINNGSLSCFVHILVASDNGTSTFQNLLVEVVAFV